MRVLHSPILLAILGGAQLAGLVLALRRFAVARRGDLGAAIELSSLDDGFSFVFPATTAALVLLVLVVRVRARALGASVVRSTSVATAAVIAAAAAHAFDRPSASVDEIAMSAALFALGAALGLVAAIVAGVNLRRS